MDSMLCDELLQEIFKKLSNSSLSSSSSSSLSLVSKRWLHLYRTLITSLALNLQECDSSTIPSLTSLLSHYPSLNSLSLSFPDNDFTPLNDRVVFLVSCLCSNLKQFMFVGGPVSSHVIVSLSNSCKNLVSVTIPLSRPLVFNWVSLFPQLKDLSVCVSIGVFDNLNYDSFLSDGIDDVELGLESVSLSGICRDDYGVDWLWRNCKKLKKLQLKRCSGVGDLGFFVGCLDVLEELELMTCRSIVDVVLLKLIDGYCDSLNSLLVYDGCSSETLLHFISNCNTNLRKLDLRLPLDLNNDHLLAVSVKFRSLSTLRLQSCCLVTGEGLKAIGIALSSKLEQLALISCDVIERESGLLATLGQHLRQLKKLDLSHNEYLLDKEFVLMLVSCSSLIELKLRGCNRLTNLAMNSLSRSCKTVESVDIMQCSGIETQGVESFLVNSPRLRRLEVEESKLSEVARTWASNRFIEVVA